MIDMHQLLARALPGSRITVAEHIARASRMAAGLRERFGVVHVSQLRLKHANWLLAVWVPAVAPAATSQDAYWRTLRCIVHVLGREQDWWPHLKGARGEKGKGGRPPKLPHKPSRRTGNERRSAGTIVSR